MKDGNRPKGRKEDTKKAGVMECSTDTGQEVERERGGHERADRVWD